MASVVFLNGDFHFPEHTACNAVDGVAQGIDSQAGIEIKDIQEILILKVEIRVVGTAGKHTVSDADGDRPSEGYFDVVYIITLQVAVCNDVEDGLPVVLPVFESQLIGNLLQLVFQRTLGLDTKGSFQCVLDVLSVFSFNPPQLIQRKLLPVLTEVQPLSLTLPEARSCFAMAVVMLFPMAEKNRSFFQRMNLHPRSEQE